MPIQRWRNTIQASLSRQAWPYLLLGFGAGLPFLLVFSTLSALLSDFGVARTTIGFLSWVGLTYSLKFLWAPCVDQYRLPFLHRLGRRRSWLLFSQAGVIIGLLIMANSHPNETLGWLVTGAFIVAFASATQDVALDAYRIETVEQSAQGIAVANYIFGYRAALLFAGAGALFIADQVDWSMAYAVMAVTMIPIMVLVSWLKESPHHQPPSFQGSDPDVNEQLSPAVNQEGVIASAVGAFKGFFQSHGSLAWLLLGLIALYRLMDMALGVMAMPFYLETGFTKSEVAAISKIFGFGMTLFGAALGGWMVLQWGQMRPLIWGAWLSLVTNFFFILLDWMGAQSWLLALVIAADNLGGGIANVALIAFMSSLTQSAYTATQYALMSSLMTLIGKIVSGFSGWIVDQVGYAWFFAYTAVLGVPALWLCYALAGRLKKSNSENNEVAAKVANGHSC